MKKGINYWSFPKGLTGEENILTAMETAKAVGFDAIELAVFETGSLALDTSTSAIKGLASAAQDIGIEICSLATGLLWDYSLTSDNATVRQKGKEILHRMLEIAALLGTDCILVVPGAVDVFLTPGSPWSLTMWPMTGRCRRLARHSQRQKSMASVWPLKMSGISFFSVPWKCEPLSILSRIL